MAKNEHKVPKCGQKRTSLGGSKEKNVKKGLSKGNDDFQKRGSRPYHPEKGAGLSSRAFPFCLFIVRRAQPTYKGCTLHLASFVDLVVG